MNRAVGQLVAFVIWYYRAAISWPMPCARALLPATAVFDHAYPLSLRRRLASLLTA